MRFAIAWVVVTVVVRTAEADDKATAQSAFVEAKAFEKAGQFREACPLYEISYRADPQLGALLNLANCHQLIGRTATAWAEFHEAFELAGRKADPRAAYAGQRADALTSRLVKLRVDASAIDGLVVRRDGSDITNLLGQDVPVDPGEYELTATAPGRVSWKTTVVVSGDGRVVRSQVPGLEPIRGETPAPAPALASAPGAPAAMRSFDDRARRGRHRWALRIGGAGAASVAVGLGFGLYAKKQWGATTDPSLCDPGGVCNEAGSAQVASARRSAQIANWTVGAGAALLVGATVVWLTAPSARETRTLAIVPVVDPTRAGAVIAGSF